MRRGRGTGCDPTFAGGDLGDADTHSVVRGRLSVGEKGTEIRVSTRCGTGDPRPDLFPIGDRDGDGRETPRTGGRRSAQGHPPEDPGEQTGKPKFKVNVPNANRKMRGHVGPANE